MSERQRKAPTVSAARAGVLRKSYCSTNPNLRAFPAQGRSPADWLLDAATYTKDGDYLRARAAARRGLRLLTITETRGQA